MLKKFYIKKEFFVQNKESDIKDYYQFLQIVGRGSFGIVYRAKMKYYPYSIRAIKRIKKRYVKNPADIIKQYTVLTSFDHPQIIKIYQTYEEEDNFYLVTEYIINYHSYCQGGELFSKLAKVGSFSQNEARKLFIQMINMIKYCHSNNVVHRDLKPQNFLLTSSKRLDLMLIDFGLCFKWNKDLRAQMEKREGKGKIAGTAFYMAPEVFTGTYDERCDIWSLGIILFILVTGQSPIDGNNYEQFVQNIKAGRLNLQILSKRQLTPQVRNLILKILVKQQQRITIQEIIQHPWMKIPIPQIKLNISFQKIKSYSKFSKFKVLVLNFIASQLSQKEIMLLGKMFLEIDKNKDGSLTVQQLCEYFKQNNQQPELDQIKNIIQSMDVDNNGRLAYNEFISACLSKSAANNKDYLKFAFDYFDLNHDGKITKKELQIILKAYKKEYYQNQLLVDKLLEDCDLNGDNKVDFDQFYRYIVNNKGEQK